MNSQINNTSDNQELKHPPHFKNVFESSKNSAPVVVSSSSVSPENDPDAMEVVENRRLSVVVPTNLDPSIIGSSTASVTSKTVTIEVSPASSLAAHQAHHHHHHHHHHHSHHNHSHHDITSPNSAEVMTPSSSVSSRSSLTDDHSIISQSTSLELSMLSNPRIQSKPSNGSQIPLCISPKTSKRLKKKKAKMFKSTSNQLSSSTSSLLSNNLPISKRFRSRSLPNIWLPSIRQTRLLINDLNHQHGHQSGVSDHSSASTTHKEPPLLPPVNLQSLHEIDLHEILKNPQLRHDILFDPQLQFRPNLDGERGKRKKMQADRYWLAIKTEIRLIIRGEKKILPNSSIAVMFQTLKDILLSLLPSKDKVAVEEIMDLNLLMQQLNSNCFNFIRFSNWISTIFKMHCAPMRDLWVDEMNSIFEQACSQESLNVDLLIDALHVLFSILEAMKLDVANHQIRILRPLLCSTAVSFEKEYFQNVLKKNKINLNGSIQWFKKSAIECKENNELESVLNYGVLNLLSCSQMCNEFPETLTFDHSRLTLLRSDIRQLICLKICLILYQTMVRSNKLSVSEHASPEILKELKKEILSIIIDENGNSKWTRNLNNLSVHFVGKLFGGKLDSSKVKFGFNWLLKQTQPSSQVYCMLERKMLDNLWQSLNTGDCSSLEDETVIGDELKGVSERLKHLTEFHYSVFGEVYAASLD